MHLFLWWPSYLMQSALNCCLLFGWCRMLWICEKWIVNDTVCIWCDLYIWWSSPDMAFYTVTTALWTGNWFDKLSAQEFWTVWEPNVKKCITCLNCSELPVRWLGNDQQSFISYRFEISVQTGDSWFEIYLNCN